MSKIERGLGIGGLKDGLKKIKHSEINQLDITRRRSRADRKILQKMAGMVIILPIFAGFKAPLRRHTRAGRSVLTLCYLIRF